MWERAGEIAKSTPAERNRYVDLLRALSISAVVLGHWIMAAPYLQAGSPQMEHLLDIQPWSRWLTWIFQVMPVFFFVGGFSNGVSWDGAQKRQQSYSTWLESRMRRLLGPVIPLVCLWAVLGAIGYWFAVHPEMIRIGSQVSLVPVWFLAIYFLIVMIVPLTREAWRRYGYLSVIVPAALAVLGDWMYFNSQLQWLGWFNYLFIWGAVHQLGYAWQQGRLGGVTRSLIMGILGLAVLIVLTQFGPYPLSLVGVPSQELSNTTPPKLPLMALAAAQIGLLLSLEGPMRRWLSRGRVWTATVLVNGFIMPIFLWHSTVMMLVIGLCFWVLPDVFVLEAGSGQWWAFRPVWGLVYFAVMMVFLPLFLWMEKKLGGGSSKHNTGFAVIIFGLGMCGGLAMLAGLGVTGDGALGLNWLAILLPIVGVSALSLIGKRLPIGKKGKK
jgi:hypothetical protein